MLAQIENAVVQTLKDAGFNVQDIDLNDRGDSAADRKDRSASVQRSKLPAVYCATPSVVFRKLSDFTFRGTAVIAVAVAFKSHDNDRLRRQGAVTMAESAAGLIGLQTLGLDISPLEPDRMFETTDDELADKGICTYQVEFLTTFDMERKTPDSALDDLLKVVATWDLDTSQTDEPEPTDTIELEGGS